LGDDSLHDALLSFLSVGLHTVANLKRRAPGLYIVWRPSSSFPGMFWRGVMEVSVASKTQAIKVVEQYRYAGDEQRTPRSIQFEGYLIRKSQLYTILARNEALSNLQTIHLPTVTIFNERVTTMAGVVTDMTTARLYTTCIYYERVPEAGPVSPALRDKYKDKMGVITKGELPDSILAFFEGRTIPYVNMYNF